MIFKAMCSMLQRLKYISFIHLNMSAGKAFNVLAIILLVVGLAAGIGIGSLSFPRTQTVTSTHSTTLTETETSYLITTILSPTTLTEEITKTLTEEKTIISSFTTTNVLTETMTRIRTVIKTITSTITKLVYPAEDGVLMRDSGSGSKNTKAFTLNETADLKIKAYLRGSPEYAIFHWYLIPVGAEEYEYIDDGEVSEDVGSFDFNVYRVPAGDYYLKILSANVKWKVEVTLMTAA